MFSVGMRDFAPFPHLCARKTYLELLLPQQASRRPQHTLWLPAPQARLLPRSPLHGRLLPEASLARSRCCSRLPGYAALYLLLPLVAPGAPPQPRCLPPRAEHSVWHTMRAQAMLHKPAGAAPRAGLRSRLGLGSSRSEVFRPAPRDAWG